MVFDIAVELAELAMGFLEVVVVADIATVAPFDGVVFV